MTENGSKRHKPMGGIVVDGGVIEMSKFELMALFREFIPSLDCVLRASISGNWENGRRCRGVSGNTRSLEECIDKIASGMSDRGERYTKAQFYEAVFHGFNFWGFWGDAGTGAAYKKLVAEYIAADGDKNHPRVKTLLAGLCSSGASHIRDQLYHLDIVCGVCPDYAKLNLPYISKTGAHLHGCFDLTRASCACTCRDTAHTAGDFRIRHRSICRYVSLCNGNHDGSVHDFIHREATCAQLKLPHDHTRVQFDRAVLMEFFHFCEASLSKPIYESLVDEYMKPMGQGVDLAFRLLCAKLCARGASETRSRLRDVDDALKGDRYYLSNNQRHMPADKDDTEPDTESDSDDEVDPCDSMPESRS